MTQEIVGSGEEDESVIRDFLLGRTADVDRERLEERLLADPAFSEIVSAIEEDLIDDYTSGLLFNDERHRFESCFLVTEERRRRVRFSTALARVRVEEIKKAPSGQGAKKSVTPIARWRGWMQVAAAAVAAVSLGTAVWMGHTLQKALVELRTAEERVASLQQSREALIDEHRRQIEEAEERSRAASISPPESVPSPRPVLVAALRPGVLRGTESSVPSLRVSSSTLLVELRLELAENIHPAYAASVHDASGTEIFRLSDLRARTTAGRILVSLQVPAAHIPQGDYSVRLWGKSLSELEELDRYYVRIVAD